VRIEELQERGGTYRANVTNPFQHSLLATPQVLGKGPASSHATEAFRFRSLSESLMRQDECALKHHNAAELFWETPNRGRSCREVMLIMLETTGNRCEKSKALSGWSSLYGIFTIEA